MESLSHTRVNRCSCGLLLIVVWQLYRSESWAGSTLSRTTQAWTHIFICMLPHTAYGLLHRLVHRPDICRLSHTQWNTQMWTVHLKRTPTYTLCLLQPDIRRISQTGRNNAAPHPLELIHFTALLFVSFHTNNLFFHLHLLISASLSLFLSSSLSNGANRIAHPSPALCSPCLLLLQHSCWKRKQMKTSWKALRSSGSESYVMKVRARVARRPRGSHKCILKSSIKHLKVLGVCGDKLGGNVFSRSKWCRFDLRAELADYLKTKAQVTVAHSKMQLF